MDQNHHPSDTMLANLSESSGLTRNGPPNGLRDQSDAGKEIVSDLTPLFRAFFCQFHTRLTQINEKFHHFVRACRVFGMDYSMG